MGQSSGRAGEFCIEFDWVVPKFVQTPKPLGIAASDGGAAGGGELAHVRYAAVANSRHPQREEAADARGGFQLTVLQAEPRRDEAQTHSPIGCDLPAAFSISLFLMNGVSEVFITGLISNAE